LNLDSLAAQMNITDAEIEAWGQANYPQLMTNKSVIKRLYLVSKGVRFGPPFQPRELRSINQLVVGETADIQVVVVQELSTRSHLGCPNDSKNIPDAIEGKDAVCPKCGQIVKPRSLQWVLFLVGDASGETIACFPPSITDRPKEGMTIIAEGAIGNEENEEFLVHNWSPLDTKKEGQTEQPQTPSPQSSVPTDAPMQAPQHPAAAPQEAQKKPSEPARNLARKAGLLHKDYAGFERNFRASFPGEDLQAAIASANCKVIEGKVVFAGG